VFPCIPTDSESHKGCKQRKSPIRRAPGSFESTAQILRQSNSGLTEGERSGKVGLLNVLLPESGRREPAPGRTPMRGHPLLGHLQVAVCGVGASRFVFGILQTLPSCLRDSAILSWVLGLAERIQLLVSNHFSLVSFIERGVRRGLTIAVCTSEYPRELPGISQDHTGGG
jgi:hypothetical protein